MSDEQPDGSPQRDHVPVTFEPTGVRQVRATALGRRTHGVPDVRRMVETQFHVTFPHRVWVAGQVSSALVEGGDVRFTLRTATDDDAFSLCCLITEDAFPAVQDLLRRSYDAEVGDVVREHRLARVGGLLRFDAARGSVQFIVSELDPTPTLKGLAADREEVLRTVTDVGLSRSQRMLSCAAAPLAVAVVGSQAAVSGVAELLSESRFDIRLCALPVDLARPDAPGRLASALTEGAANGDVVLLVREEGRPLSLAAYDALEVAEAVAGATVPVVTGLAGDGTRTACDEVAFCAQATPEAAAGWVVTRLGEAETSLSTAAAEVEEEVRAARSRCRRALLDTAAEVEQAAQEAVARSEQARRRRSRALLAGCAVIAVLVVLAAVVMSQPLVLLLVVVPVAVLGAALLWRGTAHRGMRRLMGQQDDDFRQVLVRLQAVRDELTGTTSPERVAALQQVARELVEQAQRLLGTQGAAAEPPQPAQLRTAATGSPASRQRAADGGGC